MTKANRVIKIVAIICFVLLALALLAIHKSPATGYEPSIYTATPLIVWACLIISIACGIGIVVYQVYHNQEDRNLWLIGLGLILLSTTIILSLHILRGYPLWCAAGDPGSHLGRIQDIIASGHTKSSNFYPIIHIYLTQLSQFCNLDPVILIKWVPAYFALLYMVFIYFLAKSILPDRRQVILAAIAGTTLIGGWYLNLTPNHLSNLLFPLAVYLLVRSCIPGTMSWKILFLIMAFLYAPFHPLPAIALLIAVLTISLPGKIFPSFSKEAAGVANSRFRFNAAVSILLLVLIVTWLSSFYVWSSVIQNVHTLVTEGGATPFTKLTADVTKGIEYGYSPAQQFLRRYSGIVIYILLALATFPILLRKTSDKGKYARLLGLYGPLAIIALFIVISFFSETWFGPLRWLTYIVMICSVFVGFTLVEFMRRIALHNKWRGKIAAPLVVALLLIVSINGILNVYPSPYVLGLSSQTTQTEIDGMDFLFHNKDKKISVSSWSIPLGRYAFLLTPEERKQHKHILSIKPYLIPEHFGYDEHQYIGQPYDEDMYLILSQGDKIAYAEVGPQLAWATGQDFDRLPNDPSIDKLYINGGFDMWYVHAMP